jgi:hypothetical protein
MKKGTIILLVLSTLALPGCYVHYPSVGVRNNRVRPTDWAGRRIITQCESQKKTPRCYKYNLEDYQQ